MARLITNQFVPDYAVHPGEILEEYLDGLSMSQAQLSSRTDLTPKHINEIIKGKSPITHETALKLECVLGRSLQYWINLQNLYDETMNRLADRKRLEADTEWLSRFPIKKMIELKWIEFRQDAAELVAELLSFFGVASREQWKPFSEDSLAVAFRQSQKSTIRVESVSAWLRQGERQAQKILCEPYDRDGFRRALDEARLLTREPPQIFQNRLVKLCADVGVAVAFVPELPNTGLSGATKWLAPDKALIQLSLRYKSDDQLWFTFFHEAGHILLHGKKDVFLEWDERESQDKEVEAHRFAADILIPPDRWRSFMQDSFHTLASVESFAEQIGVAPGIVVGRLQHDKHVLFSWGNRLKKRFVWKTPEKSEE
ncbi:MAG: HigA family addiction module antidote protein [Magnetococcales bacterium]|nr:HigA family addiction module antidote protein [Magnetococcales bacterium]